MSSSHSDRVLAECFHRHFVWQSYYKDHDAFVNTLRWIHARIKTPILEENENEQIESSLEVPEFIEPPPQHTTIQKEKKHKKNDRKHTEDASHHSTKNQSCKTNEHDECDSPSKNQRAKLKNDTTHVKPRSEHRNKHNELKHSKSMPQISLCCPRKSHSNEASNSILTQTPRDEDTRKSQHNHHQHHHHHHNDKGNKDRSCTSNFYSTSHSDIIDRKHLTSKFQLPPLEASRSLNLTRQTNVQHKSHNLKLPPINVNKTPIWR